MAKAKVPMLDRERPFGTIFPGSPRCSFEQDGKFFDSRGRLSDAPEEPAEEPPVEQPPEEPPVEQPPVEQPPADAPPADAPPAP